MPEGVAGRTRTEALFQEIARWVAGGETSYARQMGVFPLVIARSEGPFLYDEDGRRYIDYCCGYGVNLFGHNPPWLVEAVFQTIRTMGPHFAFPHRLYAEVGERIARFFPSIEQVRFANSGTEAVMAAVRLARAITGRPGLLKFEGAYHGWADPVCVGWGGSGPGSSAPESAGVLPEAVAHVWVCPFNDLEAARACMEAHGREIAAILVEPILGSGGLLTPLPGFLEGLRALADRWGALLIFDEVLTGFRVAPGGAQALYGVRPDLTVLGKILGGGFALAAFGGPRELMKPVAEGRVVHGGTYTGSPTVLAAARAVLDRLEEEGPALYAMLEQRTEALARGLEAAMRVAGLIGHVRRAASMLLPVLGVARSEEARSWRDLAALQDAARYRRFCEILVRHGIFAHRFPLGRWFLSTAHDERILQESIDRIAQACEELAREAG
jgi:glutamate-1-semialdehyde 2,1-aminomutase